MYFDATGGPYGSDDFRINASAGSIAYDVYCPPLPEGFALVGKSADYGNKKICGRYPRPTLTLNTPVEPYFSLPNPLKLNGKCTNTDNHNIKINLYGGEDLGNNVHVKMSSSLFYKEVECFSNEWGLSIEGYDRRILIDKFRDGKYPSLMASGTVFNDEGYEGKFDLIEIYRNVLTLETPQVDLWLMERPVKWTNKNPKEAIELEGKCGTNGNRIEFYAKYEKFNITNNSYEKIPVSKTIVDATTCNSGSWSAKLYVPDEILESNRRTIYLDANEFKKGSTDNWSIVVASFIDEEKIQIPPPDLVIGFVNGIDYSRDDAKKWTEKIYYMVMVGGLSQILNNAKEAGAGIYSLSYMNHYQPFWDSVWMALNQSIIQGRCTFNKSDARKSMILLAIKGDSTDLKKECGVNPDDYLLMSDSMKIISSTADVLVNQAKTNLEDKNTRHVIIGHSQGTAYTNLIYYSLLPEEKRRVGLVHIASIASEMGDGSNRWTTANDDFIINLLRSDLEAMEPPIMILGPNPSYLKLDISFPNHGIKEYLEMANAPILGNINDAIIQVADR
ncbi:MAG: hypothetical protein HQK54_13400 [Oligoflexales bacterium]|nr:hypothetical protein [Oligoflexales bacterium]